MSSSRVLLGCPSWQNITLLVNCYLAYNKYGCIEDVAVNVAAVKAIKVQVWLLRLTVLSALRYQIEIDISMMEQLNKIG